MMGMRLKSEGVLMSGDCVCAVVGGVVVGVRGYMRVASRPVYHPPHFTNRSPQPPPLPPFSEFPASEAICSISPGIMEIREEWRVDYGLQVPPSPPSPPPPFPRAWAREEEPERENLLCWNYVVAARGVGGKWKCNG